VDHQFLVNIVLWGNFQMLRDVTLKELCHKESMIHGQTLQVACVYANFTESLVGCLAPTSTLDVIDVIPAQLENLKRKLPVTKKNVTLSCHDAQDLCFDNGTFDQVVLFFLLHEMPTPVRLKALKEVERVVKPGGKIVFVDYHRPDTFWWQTLMTGMYKLYEPFAMDMWEHEIQEWFPNELKDCHLSKEVYFGGLYQKVVVTK
jgi:ubiquinone/menaquinone biosynthesis C-methylase UbiE